MKCLHPLYALDTKAINEDTGKRHIKILPKRADLYSMQSLEARYGEGSILQLPCGQCVNCRINYARMWALRCVCEASYHDENYFVTLTYSPDFYPGHLVKKDLQDFIKRLRKYRKFRYFACGEYGDKFNRGHYHLIMFGLNLAEGLKPICKAPYGGYYYESPLLKKLWPYGYVSIGDVNFKTCNYVAQYTVKKINKPDVKDFPAFVTMSLKPGIGEKFFQEHIASIYDSDKVYVKSGKSYFSNPPRYFDKLLDRIYPQILADVKDERISKANACELQDLIKFKMEHVEQVNLEINVPAALNKMKEVNLRKKVIS